MTTFFISNFVLFIFAEIFYLLFFHIEIVIHFYLFCFFLFHRLIMFEYFLSEKYDFRWFCFI